MDMNLFLSLALGLSIFLVFFGLDAMWSGSATTVTARLGQYANRQIQVPIDLPGAANKGKGGRLNKLLGATAGSGIATELARADLKFTASEYVLLNIAATLIGFLVGLVIMHGNLLLALAMGAAGFYLPRWYVKYLQGKRMRAFDGQLGDTIILLSNSLRSGYSLLQSIETVSKELAPPMSVEFARVTREIGLGLTTQEALGNLLRRIPSPDLDLMITAINVQHEVGGNLAEILDTIAFTIRERVRIVGEIRSITAQQRLSGTLLSVLPVLLGVIIYVLNPTYMSKLWQETCGWVMMGTGLGMIVLGYLAIRKIINIEV